MQSYIKPLLLAASCLVSLSACTRATEDSRAKFSISFASQRGKMSGSAFTGQLMHVAINVSGPGISRPLIYSWDSHQNGKEIAAPSSFDFDVPSGEGRLIQALAVYETPSSQSMTFSYGDATVTLPSGNVSVSIPVTEVGSGNIISGRVAGRYLTGVNSGPTGLVNVSFNPGGGKPSLIIERSFIANGWFTFFMLAGANLEYTVNGNRLFGGLVDLNSPMFVPSTANGNLTRVTRATIPSSVRAEGDGQTKMHEMPAIYTWGFWSQEPALLAGKTVCNGLSSSGELTRMFRYQQDPANANTLLILNNMANGNQNFPSNADLLNTMPGLPAIMAGGGVNTACGALGPNSIPVDKKFIDGQGGDSVAGFRNIFRQDSDSNPLNIQPTGTTVTISGTVLPGVQGVYSRIRFFKRVGNATEDFRIETPMCQAIASGASGFTPAGEAVSISSTGAFSATNVGIDTTSSAFQAGLISLVACGATGPALTDLAAVGLYYPMYNYGGGGGGNGGPYLRLELSGSNVNGNNYAVTNGLCYPLSLKLYQSTGPGMADPYNATSPVTISGLNPGSTWYEIHTNADCSNQMLVNSNVVISSGSSSWNGLWLKPLNTGTDLPFSSLTTSGDGVTFFPNGNKVNVGNPSLVFSGPGSAIVWSATNQLCYEVNATRVDSWGMPIMSDPNVLNVPFTGSGFTLFDNMTDCQSNSSPLASSFSIPANQMSRPMYLRATAAGAQVLATTAVGPYPSTSWNVTNYAESASHSSLGSRFLMTPLSQKAGLCNGLKITHVNSAGDEIPLPAPSNVKVSATSSNVQFFNDPNCMSLLAGNMTYMSSQQSSTTVYFIPSSTPGSTFTIDGSSGGLSGSSPTVTVATPSPSEEPFMTYSMPAIKSVLLGSHDFSTPKTIVFSISSGATLTCDQAVSPSFSVWMPCSGQLVGNVFSWTATDAVAGTGFRFGLSAPGKPFRSYHFIPRYTYARAGKNFEVRNCDSTLTANATTDFANINTAQASSGVVCLEAGTFTQTGSVIITPGSTKILLGKTDASGNPTSILQAVTGYDIATIATAGPTFANIEMQGAAAGSGKSLVNIEGGSGANFQSYNNVYKVNGAHSIGLRVYGDQGFDSYNDTYVVDGTSYSAYGVMSTNCVVNTNSTMKSPLFKLSSHASIETTFATALKFWTSNANLQLFDVKVDPAFNQGTFLTVSNSANTYTANLTVTNSAFSLSGLGANLNRFPLYIDGTANINFDGVRLENSIASDLIRGYQTIAGALSLTFSNSKLINLVDQRIMFVNSSTFAQNLNTSRTHFIRAIGAGNSSNAIDSSTALNWAMAGPQLSNPNTYFCGTDTGTNFLSIAGTTPNYSGGFSAPGLTNNANVSDISCQ